MTIQDAISLFDAGKITEALEMFIKLYNESQDFQERINIMSILQEASYTPNKAEMEQIYRRNIRLLSQYPFILGLKALAYEELIISMYMVSDTSFYVYDSAKQKFIYKYETATDPAFDMCLKNFENKRLYDNEQNFEKIAYITRNIRKSENLGMENHLFLHYDSMDYIVPLLLVHDWTEILSDEKLVITIGMNHKVEPEEFSSVFGIEYSVNDAKELTLEEIQRMIFGWKIANVTGTSFLADIMDFHPCLLTIPDCFFNDFYVYYLTYLKGKISDQLIPYLKSLPDDCKEKSVFFNITHVPDTPLPQDTYIELSRVSTNEFLEALRRILPVNSVPTLQQWISGIYLAFAKCHNRNLNTRVVPAVFMYPHDDMFYLAGVERKRVEFYLDMIQSYADFKIIAIIRDPVTQAGSVIRYMTEMHPMAKDKNGKVLLDPFYCVAFGSFLPKDYLFANELPIRNHIRVIRFEDLKLNPEASLESMTNFLDIPMCDTMYKTTWCGHTRDAVGTGGDIFQGFSSKPLYNQHSKYFSIFDKYRIEMLLSGLMKYYGYEALYYENETLSVSEKVSLFMYPFRFENIEIAMSVERKKASRNQGMNFVKLAAMVYTAVEKQPITVSGTPYTYSYIPWLRPVKELMRCPAYKSREYPKR